MTQAAKNRICLWYDVGCRRGGAHFYARTFPDSPPSVPYTGPRPTIPPARRGRADGRVQRDGDPLPRPLNGGPGVNHNWAFSFQVATQDQAETDRYWHAIIEKAAVRRASAAGARTGGASPGRSPPGPIEAISDPDPEAARRAFEAMMPRWARLTLPPWRRAGKRLARLRGRHKQQGHPWGGLCPYWLSALHGAAITWRNPRWARRSRTGCDRRRRRRCGWTDGHSLLARTASDGKTASARV